MSLLQHWSAAEVCRRGDGPLSGREDAGKRRPAALLVPVTSAGWTSRGSGIQALWARAGTPLPRPQALTLAATHSRVW